MSSSTKLSDAQDNMLGLESKPDEARPKAFKEAYSGWLTGLLEWSDVDAVFAEVRTRPHGWWIYDTRSELPEAPIPEGQLPQRLDEILAFVRRHHKADYCGFVYVDVRHEPRLIKVYDPRLASSCSLGTPIPAFTISAMRPERLPFAQESASHPRKGLLQRILKGRA